jgi:hypothetical protein
VFLSLRFGAEGDSILQTLWTDGDRLFCRGARHTNGRDISVLAVLPDAEHPMRPDRSAGPFCCRVRVAETVFHYVLRTGESVILDAVSKHSFAADPYIRERLIQSLLQNWTRDRHSQEAAARNNE